MMPCKPGARLQRAGLHTCRCWSADLLPWAMLTIKSSILLCHRLPCRLSQEAAARGAMAAGEGVDLIHQIGAGNVLSVLACVTMANQAPMQRETLLERSLGGRQAVIQLVP